MVLSRAAPTDFPVLVALFVSGHLENLIEIRPPLLVPRILRVRKEARQRFRGDLLQFLDIETRFLDVALLIVRRLYNEPQDMG